MKQFSIAVLEAFPIVQDNTYNNVNKYGVDCSADWDVYRLVGDGWVWAAYAWTHGKAHWLAKQMSYADFTATMVIGKDCTTYFAYGKKVE